MKQNKSNAVMASRVDPPHSLDFYPTPPWATRALCEHVIDLAGLTVWEPAAGKGDMARPLAEYAADVFASDVFRYGFAEELDFFWPSKRRAYWIVTNPPFKTAERFALTALERADRGVAIFIRLQWLEGEGRVQRLFLPHPPTVIWQFAERVPLLKGRLDKGAGTATAYAWYIWDKADPAPDTRIDWIKPCRARLERPGDYPEHYANPAPLFDQYRP